MAGEVTQRQLRNSSGEIMRRLDQGESIVVTRNGVPVGRLSPLRRPNFVSAESACAAFKDAPRLSLQRLRRDVDRLVDHDPTPRG